MNDAVSRNGVLNIITECISYFGENPYSACSVLKRRINELPTVDAVPVVRCKDCKHYQFADNRAFGFPVRRCEWTGFEDVDDEDFCSRGERKGEQDG